MPWPSLANAPSRFWTYSSNTRDSFQFPNVTVYVRPFSMSIVLQSCFLIWFRIWWYSLLEPCREAAKIPDHVRRLNYMMTDICCFPAYDPRPGMELSVVLDARPCGSGGVNCAWRLRGETVHERGLSNLLLVQEIFRNRYLFDTRTAGMLATRCWLCHSGILRQRW